MTDEWTFYKFISDYENKIMKHEFSMSQRQIVLLVMASLGLGILIFAAGWLMGNIFQFSETPTAQKKTVIRSQRRPGYKPKTSLKIEKKKVPVIPKPQPEPAALPAEEKVPAEIPEPVISESTEEGEKEAGAEEKPPREEEVPAEKPEPVISESTLEDVKEAEAEEKPPREETSPATEPEPAGPESLAEEKKEALDEEQQVQPVPAEESPPPPTTRIASVDRLIAAIAPPPAEEPPPPSPPPTTTKITTGDRPIAAISPPPAESLYAVQVGAFLSKDNADRFMHRLNRKDYQAYIFQQTGAKERVWHAVRIGTYQDLEAARSDAAAFKDKEKMPAMVMYFDSLNPVYLKKEPGRQ